MSIENALETAKKYFESKKYIDAFKIAVDSVTSDKNQTNLELISIASKSALFASQSPNDKNISVMHSTIQKASKYINTFDELIWFQNELNDACYLWDKQYTNKRLSLVINSPDNDTYMNYLGIRVAIRTLLLEIMLDLNNVWKEYENQGIAYPREKIKKKNFQQKNSF